MATFDTLTYARKLKAAGVTDNQADVHAEVLREALAVQYETVATKTDLEGVRTEMGTMRGELRAEMADMKGELRAEMADMKGELRTEMEAMRGEIRTEIQAMRADFARVETRLMRWMLAAAGLGGLVGGLIGGLTK